MPIKTIAISKLKTRPPFSTVFKADAGVLDAIVESMRIHGFDESKPIDLWHGTVVDGHTRLKAAHAAGIAEVAIFEHAFADEEAALAYAIHNQRARRNLDYAEIMRILEALEATRAKRRGSPNPNGHNQHRNQNGEVKTSMEVLTSGNSAAKTAAMVGVSRVTVERLRAVAAEPEARAALEDGASVRTAYKIAETKKKAKKEQESYFPAAPAAPAVLTLTPVEAALQLAQTPGAFTVAEWRSLDSKTRQLLLEEAPHYGAESGFNRTNENVDWAWWTWNPITGCLHDCPYCYARDIATRFYPQGFEPTFIPARLHAPRHAKVPAKATTDYREANVFACSMADLFGKWVPQEWIDAVFAEAVRAADWRFLFLTKFPRKLAEQAWPANAWVGTSVDRQFRVEIAEKSFRDVRSGVKWLSCEPMLEPLRFTSLEMFDWVVIGGESPNSHNRAGSQPKFAWVVDLYNQAVASGCQVYLKENLTFADRPKELPSVLKELIR